MDECSNNAAVNQGAGAVALRGEHSLQHEIECHELGDENKHYNASNINIKNSSAIIGDNYGIVNFNGDEKGKRFRRFQDSLHYPEMNSRYNEIKDTRHRTFEWVLDDQSQHELALGLCDWLRADEDVYLVEGKAGSGKSTFMKFLCTHLRTKELLHVWSNGSEVLLLFYSFWLVGTTLQHSMKGMLASLIYQISRTHPNAFQKNLQKMPTQRYIDDWSEMDLLLMLTEAMSRLRLFTCIFLDGLDEFDHKDDFDRLLTFIHRLSSANIKFCLSTRPEKHILKHFPACPHIRLQDVTQRDIHDHVRATLLEKTMNIQDSDYQHRLIDELTEQMCHRADGVFLWIYFVLRNVCTGLSNEDDLEILLERINELPSGMNDLYDLMWKRSNGGSKVYQNEAARIFALEPFMPMGESTV